jgi:hypothetical protein
VRKIIAAGLAFATLLTMSGCFQTSPIDQTPADYGEIIIHIYFHGRLIDTSGTQINYTWYDAAGHAKEQVVKQIPPNQNLHEEDYPDRIPHLPGRYSFALFVSTPKNSPIIPDKAQGVEGSIGCKLTIIHADGAKDKEDSLEGLASLTPAVNCKLLDIDRKK